MINTDPGETRALLDAPIPDYSGDAADSLRAWIERLPGDHADILAALFAPLKPTQMVRREKDRRRRR